MEFEIFKFFTKPSFHLFFINLQTNRLKDKKKFIIHLKNNHILAQQHYIPIYKFKVYKELINNFPGVESFFKNTVSLPIFVGLNKKTS